MPQFEEQYVGNHRRQRSLVLAMSLLCLLLAIVPRQERALFITPGMTLGAFGASFPPINLATLHDLPQFANGGDTPSAFFARTPGRPVGGSPFVDAPAGPVGGTSGGGAPGASAPGPTAASFLPTSLPANNGGGGLPFIPASFSPPSSSPVAPATTNAATTPTPVTSAPVVTPTPVPTSVATPIPTPVAAVPEPAAWLMLIVGFMGIGMMLRTRLGGRRPLMGRLPG